MTTTSGAIVKSRERSGRAPSALAFGCLVFVSSALGTMPPSFPGTTTSIPQLAPMRPGIQPTVKPTSSGVPLANSTNPTGVSVSPARRVAELRALTGLTIDQMGRLFGVSRRSVHNWINGNTMAPQHEERLATILAVAQVLPGTTPVERRAAMLDSSQGVSLFHQLMGERGEGMRLHVPGMTARERIQP